MPNADYELRRGAKLLWRPRMRSRGTFVARGEVRSAAVDIVFAARYGRDRETDETRRSRDNLLDTSGTRADTGLAFGDAKSGKIAERDATTRSPRRETVAATAHACDIYDP